MSARTIENLAKLNGRVYLYFRDEETLEQFIRDGEKEGYRYQDGASLQVRRPEYKMALNDDHTVNFLGYIGHMAFATAREMGGQKLIRVDYARYIAGEDAYILERKKGSIINVGVRR